MSPSEVHAAVRRAVASGLLHGPELGNRPNLTAVEEFLLHGVKYAFPAERGELTRGVPTSYAAEPFAETHLHWRPTTPRLALCRRIGARDFV